MTAAREMTLSEWVNKLPKHHAAVREFDALIAHATEMEAVMKAKDRPDKLGGYDETNPIAVAVKKHLRLFLSENKPAIAISGMALGVDQWYAEACIELGIPFTAAIPFELMEAKWPRASQERFSVILQKAKDVVYVSGPGYEPWKMQVRNKWMVDNCTELLAVWNGSTVGTNNCLQYAKSINRLTTIIDPRTIS